MGLELPRPVDRRSACGLGGPAAICLAVVLASFSGSAAAAEPAPATTPAASATAAKDPLPIVAPPRTISDITAILDTQKLDDPRGMQQNTRIANRKPPKGADKSTLARFYLERGQTAVYVGRAAQAIGDLTKANQLGVGLAVGDRIEILRLLSSLERVAGNHSRGLQYLKTAVRLSDAL